MIQKLCAFKKGLALGRTLIRGKGDMKGQVIPMLPSVLPLASLSLLMGQDSPPSLAEKLII
jgi:hypothetical protein